jgi:arsenate reductase-like glutaredoxin family protein
MITESHYTKEELIALIKLLPKDWDEILQKRCNRAKSTVRKALYLVNINNDIANAAFELAKEHQEQKKTLIKKNKNLIENGKV